MSISKKNNYIEEAVSFLGSSLSEIPELVSMLSSYVAEIQALEDDAWDVITKAGLDIDQAEGVQLDRIGEIIGQPRWDRSDENYRKLLKAKSLANVSTGTPEELISILRLILGDVAITYSRAGEAYASFSWSTSSASSEDEERAIIDLMLAAKPAGVRLDMTETDSSISDPFIFGSTGTGWGTMALDTRRLIDA